MSPGQTGHITGQMGRVPGTDGTHTRGCPAKILYVYWFFFPTKPFGIAGTKTESEPQLFSGINSTEIKRRRLPRRTVRTKTLELLEPFHSQIVTKPNRTEPGQSCASS